MKKWIYFTILLCLSCSAKIKKNIETYKVKKGEFHVDVVESGEIQAINAINISSPAMSWRFGPLKIMKIVEDGTEVSTGDTVILFDPSEVEKAIVDAKANLEIAKAELEKLKAEQESKIYELEAELHIVEIDYQISELKLDQATYEPDVTRKEFQLNLDNAKISLKKAKEEIENQKKIHLEEQHQSKIKIRQLENNLAEANKTLRNLTVVSQSPGVVIIRKNWRTGNKWQVDDQTWSGNPLIDLPDMSALKVETEINEVDISKIKLDQKAEIQLDAFSDTVFTGKVTKVATLAIYKDEKKESKIKVFPVEIYLDGTSKKLMPGMTVSSKIIVDKIDKVLFIPLEALHKEQNQNFVYIQSSGSFKKRRVTVGMANNDYIIIHKGLKAGQVVALSDPFEKSNQKENKNES